MLDTFVDWLLYSIIGLDSSLKWVESLNYFVYDSIKIMLLLFLMISIIGFLRTYIPMNRVNKWISGKKYGISNLIASFFGAITPFCSCSSIPIFIGFLEAGIPLGVNFSFIITSPIINEYLVVLMFAAFGWKITLAYILCGILIGVVSGIILGKMNLERNLVKDISKLKKQKITSEKFKTIKSRVYFGLTEANSIIKKLWVWVLIGVGIGALIHNYVPSETIQLLVNKGGFLSVPLAVLLGVPMYGSCAAIIPIAVVLFEKGVPIGTALAFMMAISALSLPEAVILRRVMNLKLIAIFFGIVTLSIIVIGYLLNYLQPFLI